MGKMGVTAEIDIQVPADGHLLGLFQVVIE
jgi:hypothetical protein